MNLYEFVNDLCEAAGVYLELDDSDAKELESRAIRFAMQPHYAITLLPTHVVPSEELTADNDTVEENVIWVGMSQPSSYSDISPYAPAGVLER